MEDLFENFLLRLGFFLFSKCRYLQTIYVLNDLIELFTIIRRCPALNIMEKNSGVDF